MPKPSKDHARAATKAPVSAIERDTLGTFRKTPVLETHLTPTGTVVSEVHRDVEASLEARIGFIKKRLANQNDRARKDFKHSR